MTFVIETTFTRGDVVHPYTDHARRCESLEGAAQVFESEAECGQPLSEIVEELSLEGKVEFEEDDHPWRRIVVYELVEAVA